MGSWVKARVLFAISNHELKLVVTDPLPTNCLSKMQEFHSTTANAVLRFHEIPGKGIPIVFLHGMGCASSCDYPRVVASPVLRGQRAFLVDFLGSGFSEKPESFGYSVSDHALVIEEFIKNFCSGKVHLYGHSLGGSVAIEVAAQCRKQVSSLMVSEPNLDPGGGAFSRPIAEQSEREFVKRGHTETVKSALEQGHSIWSSSLAVSLPAAIHREAVSLVKGSSPTWRELFASLPMRRTIIFGERSLPDPDTERLPKLGVKVRIVRSAGHSMAWENPTALARCIAASLR